MKKQEAKEKSKGLDHEELCKKITEMHEWIMKHSPKAFAEGGEPEVAPEEPPMPAAPTPAAPMPAADQPADPENPPVTDFKTPDNVSQSLNAPSPMQALDNARAEAVAAGPSKQYLVDQYDKYKQDILNGHITPKTYADLYADKGTLGKVGTLFGLLVSGAGSGLSGQKNAVLDMMDKVIQNDINSQIHSKENALNFLRVNQADLKNKVDAMGGIENAKTAALARTQAQVYQTTLHDLIEKAKKLPPSQQAAAQQVLTTISTRAFEKINNAHDLAAVGMAVNGRNPFNSGSQASGKPTQPGQPNQPPQPGKGNSVGASDSILVPNADALLKRVQYNPQLQPFASEISQQMADAAKADKAIDEIKRIFPRLHEEAQSPRGYLQRKAHTLSGLPLGIGPAIEGITKGFTDIGAGGSLGNSAIGKSMAAGAEQNRNFGSDRGALAAQIRAALPGISGDTLNEILEPSVPEKDDTPGNYNTKLTNLIKKIQGNLKTDKLEMAGMVRKKK